MENSIHSFQQDQLNGLDHEFFNAMLGEMETGALLLKIMRQEDDSITDFKYVYANNQAVKMLGDDPTGNKITGIYFRAPHNILFEQYKAAATGVLPRKKKIEYWSGEKLKAATCKVLLKNDHIICLLEEVKTEKETGIVLPFTATEQLLHAVFNACSDAACIFKCVRNPTNKIVEFEYAFVNKQAEKMLARNDLHGKKWGEEYPHVKNSKIWNNTIRAMTTGVSSSTHEQRPGQVALHSTAVKINHDYLVFSSTINTAAAERSFAREELGREMIHDIRNPLSAINLSAQLVQEQLQTNNSTNIMSLFTIITRNTQKIENLLTQWLIDKRPAGGKEEIDLCEILNMALDKASDRIVLSRCRVEKSFKLGFLVDGPAEKIANAFLQIFIYAIESMKAGKGELWVAVFHHPDKVLVVIKDNGEGMDPEKTAQIFNPAFTNPEYQRALGLQNAKALLQQYKANIQVHSEPGTGTTFTVHFKKRLNVN